MRIQYSLNKWLGIYYKAKDFFKKTEEENHNQNSRGYNQSPISPKTIKILNQI